MIHVAFVLCFICGKSHIFNVNLLKYMLVVYFDLFTAFLSVGLLKYVTLSSISYVFGLNLKYRNILICLSQFELGCCAIAPAITVRPPLMLTVPTVGCHRHRRIY